ncbi:acyltransferase family protein [Paraburkholderia sp. J7]|uniref:acyltransferase family protein n=1 Tax=Paraburkholderia sp. J7 TaxID=2805438 RepID=UPI002AB76515|nr:acyltransferase family protein [Paraburkholderia sp. J7]
MRMTNQAAPLSASDGGTPSSLDASGVAARSVALYRDAGDAATTPDALGKIAASTSTYAAPEHLRAPKYRPDIDGLRAIAVLSVLAFHAFPSHLRGGFVGVDLFFVISGFLISTIIFESVEEGRFSYVEFYMRRIRRIFPALVVVLAACLVAGWFLLMPEEYQQLGKHLVAGATFLSNIALWREAGYFDDTAATKPLLHLWSLGVEEQFYIFWPLLASFAYRRRLGFPLLLGGIAAASFAVSLVTSASDPTAAFYSPLSRFWELMIGGSLAWLLLHRPTLVQYGPRASNALSAAGLLLIGAAVVFINENDVFPGWRALLPTVGAFLVICAGPHAWLNKHVLANRLAVAIGLISYPLYLWHWPLLSFANILAGGLFVPVSTRLTLVLASIVLAALTYRLVELPIRTKKANRRQLGALCVALALLGVAGAVLFARAGLPTRAAADNRGFALYTQNEQMRLALQPEPCQLADAKADKFCTAYNMAATGNLMVVWGDSHGGAWLPVLRSIAVERNMRLMAFVHVGCPPLLDTRRSDGAQSGRDCSRLGLAEPIASSIEQLKPAVVFYIGRWSLYGNGWTLFGELQKATHFVTTDPNGTATLATSRAALTSQLPLTVKALAASTPRLVVFQNPPVLEGKLLPRFYADPERIEPSAAANLQTEAFERKLVESVATIPNVRVFDPVPRLCTGATCKAVLDGVPVYEDDNHVSAQGSLLFKQAILDAM